MMLHTGHIDKNAHFLLGKFCLLLYIYKFVCLAQVYHTYSNAIIVNYGEIIKRSTRFEKSFLRYPWMEYLLDY